MVNVAWRNTFVLQHHIKTMVALGYTPVKGQLHTNPSTELPPFMADLASEKTPISHTSWHNTEEKEQDMQEALGPYWDMLREQLKPPPTPSTNTMSHLTALQQVGTWPEDAPHPTPLQPKLQHSLHISTASIDPDRDVAPTGDITLHPHPQLRGFTNTYSAEGKYMGSTPADTTTSLWTRAGLPAKEFIQKHTVAMLHTLRPPAAHHLGNKLPTSMAEALRAMGHPWMEVTTTALTHSPNVTSFLSLQQEDTSLGAKGHWASQPWQGLCVMTAPTDKTLLHKMIRWGLGSAMHPDAPPRPHASSL